MSTTAKARRAGLKHGGQAALNHDLLDQAQVVLHGGRCHQEQLAAVGCHALVVDFLEDVFNAFVGRVDKHHA
ncbi:hypothetical protein LP420_15140 [Massilia sp. B-10]|nr:hypothetical protein LP420_15140 [Massilia sp. B-10]